MHRFADRSPTRSQSRVLRASVIALVLLAGCGVQRAPDSYTSSVGKNFVKSCVAQSKSTLSNPSKTCNCTYSKIKATIKFSRFKEINSQLTAKPGPLPSDITTILENCKAGGETTATTAGTG